MGNIKKISQKELEWRLEQEPARTIKMEFGKISTLFMDVIQNEIAINKDKFNLAVFPLTELIQADLFFKEKAKELK